MKHPWIFRTMSTLLCSLLLVAALAACGQQGDDPVASGSSDTDATTTTSVSEDPKFEVNIEEYALIRPDGAAQSTIDAAVLLNKTANEVTGKKFKSFTDDFVRDESEIDAAAYEILIGDTNRPQSAEALKDISYGYVIAKIGNKIVINATVSSLVDDAVNEFITTYLTGAANSVLAIPEDLYIAKASEGSLTVLNEKGKSNFTLVFSDDLDNTKGAEVDTKDRYDYVVKCAMDFRNEFLRKFKEANLPLSTDWVKKNATPDSSSYEILVGDTNRPEAKTFRDSLAINEYGFGVVGNKIVVSGWSDLTIGLALDLFSASFSDFLFTDANGNSNLILAADTRVVKTFDNWNTDIPTYDSGVFGGVMEGLDSCYELYYTETTADQFKAYRAKLEAAGYKLHQENQDNGNLFATYYNDTNMIHTYYVNYLKSVRIITEPMKDCTLPANEDSYTKITDTTFTMMDLDYEAGNFGNAFIITLEDGSFIIHDGGADAGKDKAELYSLLTRLNKRKDGKIVIAAWILSHEHWDHYKNFYDFCNTYSSTVVLEQVLYNVARTTINYNSNNPGSYIANGSLKGLSITTKCKLVKFHTGQTAQIRNLKIECVYTQEDIYPQKLHTFNNSSMVTRFSIDGQRFTILGDIQDQASDIMVKMYGNSLKTDILQVAHHGVTGGTTALYSRFRPTVLIWPTDQNSFTKQTAGTRNDSYFAVDYTLSKQPNVKLIVLADNGHKTIPLPITDYSEKSVTILPVTRK